MTDNAAADQALLDKLNVAVAAANEAEKTAETAKAEFDTQSAELVSRSRVVAQLLLEAKKRHPAVRDFEAFLKRVNGLKLSRAYDLLRLAGGRATNEQLRKEQRDRVRRHRAKKKLATPKPAPLSVTHPDVTETPNPEPEARPAPEISAEERRVQNAALDTEPEPSPKPEPWPGSQSAYYRNKFIDACRDLLCRVEDESDRAKVIRAFNRATKDWQCANKAKAA